MDNRKATAITLDNVRIIWSNFAGQATEYNEQGKRNFNLLLSEEQAQLLEKAGANVKRPELTEEQLEQGYSVDPRIKVNLKYQEDPNKEYLNPTIMMVTNGVGKKLDATNVGILDGLRFDRVKVGISVSPYSYGRRSGYTIYLRNMIAFVRNNEWEEEYAMYQQPDFPDVD